VSPTFSVVALIATTIYILVSAVQVLQNTNAATPNVIVMWSFMLLNLIIDLVNMFLFVRERRRKAAELRCIGIETHVSNANMLSALTHVAIDTMRTVSVLIALMANTFFGLPPSEADAYASIAIGILTFFSTVPLCRVLRHKVIRLKELGRVTRGMRLLCGELRDIPHT
jgi:Co/Zn/Cd efflux system component